MSWETKIYITAAILAIITESFQIAKTVYKIIKAIGKSNIWKDRILREQIILAFVIHPSLIGLLLISFKQFQGLGMIPIMAMILYLNLRYWYLHNQTKSKNRRVPKKYMQFVVVFSIILFLIISYVQVISTLSKK